MSYYPDPDSHIRDKFKVVLYLSNYPAKKELTILQNVEVDKLDINELVNVSTDLNNIKTKVDDLDDDKLKTIPKD